MSRIHANSVAQAPSKKLAEGEQKLNLNELISSVDDVSGTVQELLHECPRRACMHAAVCTQACCARVHNLTASWHWLPFSCWIPGGWPMARWMRRIKRSVGMPS